MSDTDAVDQEVAPYSSPLKEVVEKTIHHLINGDLKEEPKLVGRLDRAVDQAKRGATGPLPRVT